MISQRHRGAFDEVRPGHRKFVLTEIRESYTGIAFAGRREI